VLGIKGFDALPQDLESLLVIRNEKESRSVTTPGFQEFVNPEGNGLDL